MKRSCKRLLNALKNKFFLIVFCFLSGFYFQTGNFLLAQTDLNDSLKVTTDSTQVKKKKSPKIHKPTVPWKAALMSGFVPGLGQIYNRKYWKLPIVWGAIGTSGYFLVDQHIKYVEYRDAYRALINDTIVLPGFEAYQFNPGALKSERDNFERTRNILTIVTAVLWTLNIVDAAVDAHLSTFDVSPNLTMRIQPSTFYHSYSQSPAVGLTLTFGLR